MTSETTGRPARVPHDPDAVRYHFDRHAADYRDHFLEIMNDLHAQAPISWNDTYGGHWLASTQQTVFDLARRADVVSSYRDVTGEGNGYGGITIPPPPPNGRRGGFQELDPPEQRYYRQALNAYLSPAAVERWRPVVQELVRACLDERIETGRIDFVDDLANIVPAVFTMAMLGLPLADWDVYCEPAHAGVYTSPNSPDIGRVREAGYRMAVQLGDSVREIRDHPRPGMTHALISTPINGNHLEQNQIEDILMLLIGGGFDTTTALTAHSLEWLSENPAERERLSVGRDALLDTATEEFLRYFTPAPGIARTISGDAEIDGVRFKEGERLWLSWAMANRDPSVFDEPNALLLDRPGNRHSSFGLGIHRCIGSNVARMTFKEMLVAVLDRMPDFACDREGAVHYETIGIIQGMQHLPATFTPGPRLGAGLEETIATLQQVVDNQRLAEPVTSHRDAARL